MSLDAVIASIRKQRGAEGILSPLSKLEFSKVEGISTGSLGLDYALRPVFGFPRGRMIEVFGPEGGGKTTLALGMVAAAQAQGKTCVYSDAEHALDRDYAEAVGVDITKLLVDTPDYGEQALDAVMKLARSGEVDLIIIDSVVACVPKAMLEGGMDYNPMGDVPLLWSQAAPQLNKACEKKGTTIVLINQIREKIGVVFGNPETTPGGHALKFFSSVRVRIGRGEAIKDGDETIAYKAKLKTVKSKVCRPQREEESRLVISEGFDIALDCLAIGKKLKLVKQEGSWLSYKGKNLGQGEAKSRVALMDDQELLSDLYWAIRENAPR